MLKQLLLLLCMSILVLFSAEAEAATVVDYIVDRYDSAPDLACDRFTPNDCSLHSALQLANASNSDLKRISFYEDATVTLTTLLPTIAKSDIFIYASPNIDVTIDGAGLSRVLRVDAANTTIDGLTLVNQDSSIVSLIDGATDTTIRNSVIGGIQPDGNCELYENMPSYAVSTLQTAGTTWIHDNTIRCTTVAGVYLNSTGGIVYVGETAAGESAQNILRDNGLSHTIYSGGVSVRTNNHVIRNNQLLDNSNGINIVEADGVQVYDNEIRGNSTGIYVSGDSNWIRRNFIGGNSFKGMRITGDANSIGCNLFGPYDANEGNYIYNNSTNGIEIAGTADNSAENNAILCNKIGLSPFATSGNVQDGIFAHYADGTNIGMDGASGNVIGGNGRTGIAVYDSDDVGIIGNRIGINSDGSDIGNGDEGVYLLRSADATVGGTTAADANHIGNNTGDGLYAVNSVGLVTRWNYIGFNATDLTTAPNQHGIYLLRADEAMIGVDCVETCTHVGNNSAWGIFVREADSVEIGRYTSVIQNNSGIKLDDVALSTIRPAALTQNGSGISIVWSGDSNVIQPQQVTQSGALPIDYNEDGYTANDANDNVPDHPLITSQQDTLIVGKTCANCQVDIYGATFDGSRAITSATYRDTLTANGNGDFSVDLAIYNLAPDSTALTATQFGTSEMVELIMSNEVPTAITLGSTGAHTMHITYSLIAWFALLCTMTRHIRRPNV